MKDKPSFPARLAGWEYQYKRAERLLELLREIKRLLISFTTEGSNGQELFDILALFEIELEEELGDD